MIIYVFSVYYANCVRSETGFDDFFDRKNVCTLYIIIFIYISKTERRISLHDWWSQ